MTQTVNGGGPARPATEQSTGELVQHASEQFSRLVREELELARAELTDTGRRAGRGAGMLGGSGLMALYGVGALVLAAIFGLAVVLPNWLAALLVGVAVLLVAGFLALIGREQVRSATSAMPGRTSESLRADFDTVSTAVRERKATSSAQRQEGEEPQAEEPRAEHAQVRGTRTQQPQQIQQTSREEARP